MGRRVKGNVIVVYCRCFLENTVSLGILAPCENLKTSSSMKKKAEIYILFCKWIKSTDVKWVKQSFAICGNNTRY